MPPRYDSQEPAGPRVVETENWEEDRRVYERRLRQKEHSEAELLAENALLRKELEGQQSASRFWEGAYWQEKSACRHLQNEHRRVLIRFWHLWERFYRLRNPHDWM